MSAIGETTLSESKVKTHPLVAAVFLAFLSSFVEFLLGNLPLHAVFSPIVILNAIHYGCGANLIREFTARWKRGLPSVLLLGAVYAMFNEAMTSKGFFDPEFYAVVGAGLANFGRWGNINVVWALGITVVHVVFSITVPITLTDALFPESRGRLGNKTLGLMLVMFSAAVFVMSQNMNPYRPGWNEWSFIVVLMVALVIAARVLPPISLSDRMALPGNATLFTCGFLSTIAFSFTSSDFHRFIHDPVQNVLAMICALATCAWLLLRLPELSMPSKVALAAGVYSLPILGDILSGGPVQATVAVAVLVAAWRRSTADTAGVHDVRAGSVDGDQSHGQRLGARSCLLLIAGGCVFVFLMKPRTALPPLAANKEFGEPERVTIRGYTGPAEDAYITPDSRYLLFNSHTDDPKIPCYIHYARRIDHATFEYLGEVKGINEPHFVQATANMDLAGNFYFTTNGHYDQSLKTIYRGAFKDGQVTAVAPVLGISRDQRGWANMEAEISPDGRTLYYADTDYRLGHPPVRSKLAVAARTAGGTFVKLSHSDELLENVNAVSAVVYNGMASRDGLELYFTAAFYSVPAMQIYVAKRRSISEPFGPPESIASVDVFRAVESGSISPDGKYLYYHQVLSLSDAKIYVATRQSGPKGSRSHSLDPR